MRLCVRNAPDCRPVRSVLFSRYHIKKLGYCLLLITCQTVRQRPAESNIWLSTSLTAVLVQRNSATDLGPVCIAPLSERRGERSSSCNTQRYSTSAGSDLEKTCGIYTLCSRYKQKVGSPTYVEDSVR